MSRHLACAEPQMAIRSMPPTLSYRVVKAIGLWLQANRCSGLSMRVACGPWLGRLDKLGVTGSSPVPPHL
jgi:hypothetical protein